MRAAGTRRRRGGEPAGACPSPGHGQARRPSHGDSSSENGTAEQMAEQRVEASRAACTLVHRFVHVNVVL